jgi:hypothetical protein
MVRTSWFYAQEVQYSPRSHPVRDQALPARRLEYLVISDHILDTLRGSRLNLELAARHLQESDNKQKPDPHLL